MGLYLCVFDEDEELEGVEVGYYADFARIREFIAANLEDGVLGSRFPTFGLHHDSEGEWSIDDCGRLKLELAEIAESLKALPPLAFDDGWQKDVARSIGLQPQNAFESMIDVDGEFLFERLQHLVEVALRNRLPILFQ